MSKREEKKSIYSCIEEKDRVWVNPINVLKRWGRNIKHSYQRIRYGYCDTDVWAIDSWFLTN